MFQQFSLGTGQGVKQVRRRLPPSQHQPSAVRPDTQTGCLGPPKQLGSVPEGPPAFVSRPSPASVYSRERARPL